MATEQHTNSPWIITDSNNLTTRRYLKNADNGGWRPEWTHHAIEAHRFEQQIDMLVVGNVLARQGVYAVSVPLADVLDVPKAA